MSDEPLNSSHEQKDSEPCGYEAFKSSLRKSAIERVSRNKKKKDYFDKWENKVAFATLLFVFVYTIVTGWQLFVLRDQEKRQLRAYVGALVPDSKEPIQWPTDDGTIALHLKIKNFGPTPAYEMEYIAGINFRDYPLSDKTDWSIPQPTTPPTRMTLFPGSADGDIVAKMTYVMSPQQFDSIKDGKSHQLLIWGTIKYRDAFNDWHLTSFCVGVFGDLVRGSYVIHQPCDRHTESD